MVEVTVGQLRAAGACDGQVEKFVELFGDRVSVTPELCVAHASTFDWGWAARRLLTPEQRARYEAARAEARARYDAATAKAGARFDAATEEARAWARYEAEMAEAWAAYDAARAEAFGRALCG